MTTRKPKMVLMLTPNQCENCRHFGSYEGVECCKRYPPIPLFDGEDVVTHYPVISKTDICGEWSPILAS